MPVHLGLDDATEIGAGKRMSIEGNASAALPFLALQLMPAGFAGRLYRIGRCQCPGACASVCGSNHLVGFFASINPASLKQSFMASHGINCSVSWLGAFSNGDMNSRQPLIT